MRRKNNVSDIDGGFGSQPGRILRAADRGDVGDEDLVLNMVLYHRLLSHFDSVRVSRRGQARAATVAPALLDDGLEVTVAQVGEQYHVCCCFCDDVHQCLSVNHMYGQLDDSGRRLTFLAYCHHANCLRLNRNRAALAAMLQADDGILEYARIRPGRAP